MKLTVKESILLNGKGYRRGDVIEAEKADAETLIRMNWAEKVRTTKKK